MRPRDLTVAHTGERVQFGRSLSKFQAVQHSLAAMAGEIERARAATDAGGRRCDRLRIRQRRNRLRRDGGEGRGRARRRPGHHDRAPAARRDRCDRRAPAVAGHHAGAQLDRASSAAPAHYARRLGRMALAADDPWDVVVSCPAPR